MKLLKALAGKTMFAILAILLQIAIYIFLASLVEDAIQYFIQVIALPNAEAIDSYKLARFVVGGMQLLIALIVIVRLTIRDMLPDAKVAWVTVLVFAPVAGSILYMLFSHNRPSRHKRILYMDIHARGKKYTTSKDDCADALGDYLGQSRYLYNASYAVPRRYSDVKFYPTGELFFEDLKAELEKAEKYILMEYFIVERGAMWDAIEEILVRKAAQGVVVKFMYDDIGCLPRIERSFYKKLRAKGIDCQRFNKFTPIVSATHNNRDHRKITVVDGKVGFMGGINLADEYINVTHPLGQWKDSAVKLQGEAVQNLIMLFMTLFDAQDDSSLENYEFYIPEYYEWYDREGIVQPFGDSPRPLLNDNVAEDCILNMINQAKNYMYITTPYLILDHTLTDALCRAAKRGVDVRIITPRIPDKKIVFWISRRNYKPLLKAGVKIYEYVPGFIHAKNYLVDDVVGMVGTINMDYRSLVHHFESGVWMYNMPCLADMKKDFDETFPICEQMTEKTSKLGLAKRMISAVGSMFSPLL